MGEHHLVTGEQTSDTTAVTQATNLPSEFTEPTWTPEHPHVDWPKDFTNDQKVAWLLKEFHLFAPEGPKRQVAGLYAGPYTEGDNGFDWNNYDPDDHVLVHWSVFREFLQWGDEAEALRKGMKTINRKRRKANAVQRRTERRLAQARSSRDQLRRLNEGLQERATEAITHTAALHSRARDLGSAYAEIVKGLQQQLADLRAELDRVKSDIVEQPAVPSNDGNTNQSQVMIHSAGTGV